MSTNNQTTTPAYNGVVKDDNEVMNEMIASHGNGHQQHHMEGGSNNSMNSSFQLIKPENQNRVNLIFQADMDQIAMKIENENNERMLRNNRLKANNSQTMKAADDNLLSLEEKIRNKTMNANNNSNHNSMNNNNAQLLSLEEKIRNKNIAMNAASNHSVNNNNNAQLLSLEEKIAQKTNAANNNSVNININNNNNAQLLSLEEKIAQKTAAANNKSVVNMNNTTSNSTSTGLLNSNLINLEERIARKNSEFTTSTHTTSTTSNSAAHANLMNLEERIARKNSDYTTTTSDNNNGNNNNVLLLSSNHTTTTQNSTCNDLSYLGDRIAMKLASGTMQSNTMSSSRRATGGNSLYGDEMARSKELIAGSPVASGGNSIRSLFSVPTATRNHNTLRPDPNSSGLMHDDSIRSLNSDGTSRPQDSKLTLSQSPSGRRVGAFSVPSLPPINARIIVNNSTGSVWQLMDHSNSKPFDKDEYDNNNQDILFGGSDANLAVALPVLEEEDDYDYEKYLPAAIEFDPDQKAAQIKKNYRSKLFIYITILMIIISVIVASVVTGIVISNNNNNVINDNTTTTEVNPREQIGIKELIVSQIMDDNDNDALNDVTSPFNKALNWITNIDPLQLTIDTPNFLQRFLIVYLYYTTSIDHEWDYCDNVKPSNNSTDNTTETNNTDSINNTDITDTDNNNNKCRISYDCVRGICWFKKKQTPWLSINNECEWAGITCDKSGNILVIEIGNVNATGTLSDIKMKFPFLKILELSDNQLKGTIPSNINQWKHLNNLLILSNEINGIIPMEFYYHRNIIKFQAWSNNISGLLFPPSLSDIDLLMMSKSWKNYKTFDVGNNQLSGTISSTIITPMNNNLDKLALDGNNFESTIPNELFILPQLKSLLLSNNQLTGRIPEIINTPLQTLYLKSNQLNGTIPDSMYNLTSLIELILSNNQFSGTISTKIANFKDRLGMIQLDMNQFSGTLPSEIGQLTLLEEVNIIGNQFNDTIPTELCDLTYMSLIKLSADCLSTTSSSTTTPSTIVCPKDCCTECCAQSGTECLSM